MPDQNGKKVRVIKARLSESEYQRLLSMEKHCQLNRTEIIRSRLFKTNDKVLIDAKELVKRLDSIGIEMGRSGNNINQLARHANTMAKQGTLSADIVADFRSLFSEYIDSQKGIEKTLRQIIRLMSS